jgi:actin-related protein 10
LQLTEQVFSYAEQRPASVLREIVVRFVYEIVYLHLMVKTTDRRVVVAESLVAPASFRGLLADVLFRHFGVISVLFVPAPLFTLLPVGAETGLVVDCGYSETQVVAVYDGTPLLGSFVATAAASKMVHDEIGALLVESGAVAEGTEIPEAVLEDIKVRAGLAVDGVEVPTVDYRMPSGATVKLDAKIRTGPINALFTGEGIEADSITHAVLTALKRCPVDTRMELAANIVLVGGTAMIPGFRSRLAQELAKALDPANKCKEFAVLRGVASTRTKYTVNLSAASGSRMDCALVMSDKNRLLDMLINKLGDDVQVTDASMVVDAGITDDDLKDAGVSEAERIRFTQISANAQLAWMKAENVQVWLEGQGLPEAAKALGGKALEGTVRCTLITPDDPDKHVLEGLVGMDQRSYTTESSDDVVQETMSYSAGVGNALAFFVSPFPENYMSWFGAATLGALASLPDRSLAKDAYLKDQQVDDWSNQNLVLTPATPTQTDQRTASAAGPEPSLGRRGRAPYDRPRAWGLGSLAELNTPSLVP